MTIGDGLSALHFFQPWTRKQIPHSWKLFRTWRRIEVPARAPPLTLQLVRSMAAFELSNSNLEMACILLLGFHCLLWTGELLQVAAEDFISGKQSGVLRLSNTKTSQRFAAQAAHDAISRSPYLTSLVDIRNSGMATKLWNGRSQSFRKRFNEVLLAFGVQKHLFRPYSLRRGGEEERHIYFRFPIAWNPL